MHIFDRKVEFQHCDPAGILFFPRYFEMLNSVIEEWFDTKLDYSFHAMHMQDGKGVPTAEVAAKFVLPSRLGDVLNFGIHIIRAGSSSLELDVQIHCKNTKRVQIKQILVFIDLASGKPEKWPEIITKKFEEICLHSDVTTEIMS